MAARFSAAAAGPRLACVGVERFGAARFGVVRFGVVRFGALRVVVSAGLLVGLTASVRLVMLKA